MRKQKQRRHNSPKKHTPAKKITLKVTDYDSQGIGKAFSEEDRKSADVLYGLPDETLETAVLHEGHHKIYAVATKVVGKRNPARIRSCCSIHSRCQSCLLIHTGSPFQARFKEKLVTDALKQVPDIADAEQLPLISSPEAIGYRTNAKLAFGTINRKVVIGVFKRHSHEIISTADCPVHHPLINTITRIVQEEVEHQKISIYNGKTGRGLLRYMIIKVSPHNNTAMVTLVTAYRDIPVITKFAKWIVRKAPEIQSVFQNINGSQGNVIFGNTTLKMYGKPLFVDKLNQFSVGLLPTSFFQVNHTQAEQMYRLIAEWAAVDIYPAILDIYCGIGGIAMHLAHLAKKVIGIEYVADAVINARNNTKHNGFNHCKFYAGDASEVLSERIDSIPANSLVAINPPRKGCDQSLLDLLPEAKPKRIIYVSCNPESLARDLTHLSQYGYKPTRIQPLDMFPQTEHVETVVEILPNNR